MISQGLGNPSRALGKAMLTLVTMSEIPSLGADTGACRYCKTGADGENIIKGRMFIWVAITTEKGKGQG